MKTVVSTALYDIARYKEFLKFAPETLQSLNDQSDPDFDLVFFAEPEMFDEVQALCDKYAPRVNLVLKPLKQTIPNRTIDNLSAFEQRMEYISIDCKDMYDKVLFVDLDDVLPKNYHETMKRVAEQTQAVIVGADQWVFSQDGIDMGQGERLISSRFNNGIAVDQDNILKGNRFGFCNTLLDLKRMREIETSQHFEGAFHRGISDLPASLNPAPDWFYFARVIASGAKAVFTDETHIFYRQHEHQWVGNNKNGYDKVIQLKHDFFNSVFKMNGLDGNFPRYLMDKAKDLAGIFAQQVAVLPKAGESYSPEYQALCDHNNETKPHGVAPMWWETARARKPQDLVVL